MNCWADTIPARVSVSRLDTKRDMSTVIASWNVNSIRARMAHATRFLEARKPDVLLMQELKGLEFPADEFRALGYESVSIGQKSYNGVGILSRLPIEMVTNRL